MHSPPGLIPQGVLDKGGVHEENQLRSLKIGPSTPSHHALFILIDKLLAMPEFHLRILLIFYPTSNSRCVLERLAVLGVCQQASVARIVPTLRTLTRFLQAKK